MARNDFDRLERNFQGKQEASPKSRDKNNQAKLLLLEAFSNNANYIFGRTDETEENPLETDGKISMGWKWIGKKFSLYFETPT